MAQLACTGVDAAGKPRSIHSDQHLQDRGEHEMVHLVAFPLQPSEQPRGLLKPPTQSVALHERDEGHHVPLRHSVEQPTRGGQWAELRVEVEEDVGAEGVQLRHSSALHDTRVHGAAGAGVTTSDAALQEPCARVGVELGERERRELVVQPLQRCVGGQVTAERDIGL